MRMTPHLLPLADILHQQNAGRVTLFSLDPSPFLFANGTLTQVCGLTDVIPKDTNTFEGGWNSSIHAFANRLVGLV
jgi:hypothetical protein